MPYEKGLHPGAVWRKTDFQIHTPRDAQWKGGENLSGGSLEEEDARRKWADDFITACLDKGLAAIAITDHHDICMIPYVRDAIQRRGCAELLWLFPGVEITCKDAVQALILFDSTVDYGAVAALFNGAIKNTGVYEPHAAKGPDIGADGCGRSLSEFIQEVKTLAVVKDRCIVLPHAGEGGHKTILRDGFHNLFKEADCDGFYCEHGIDAFKVGSLKVFRGEIEAWGKRRRGVITTGDNRSSGYERLGVFPTWIRLGEPTAEAIRQALLADEARIAYMTPDVPAFRVLELSVDSRLTGPFKVSLNDGFNAFIGGRGSGKSALMEFLRFGLGRGAQDMQVPAFIGERERDLVKDTLREEGVQITLVRNGIIERWKRTLAKKDTILVCVDGGDPQEVPVEEARNLFPARTYYQKELSTLGQADGNVDERITKIAAADYDEARRSAEALVKLRQRELDGVFRGLVELWRTEASHASAVRTVNDIQRRMAQVAETLKQLNINAEDQKTLELEPKYIKGEAVFQDVSDAAAKLSGFISKLVGLTTAHGSANWPAIQELEQFPEVRGLRDALDKGVLVIGNALMSAGEAMQSLNKEIAAQRDQFNNRRTAFKESYDKAAANVEAHRSQLDQLTSLNRELIDAANHQKRLAARLSELGEAAGTFQTKRDALTEAIRQRGDLLEKAAQAVATQSNDLLRASVCPENPPKQVVDAIRALAEGTRIVGFEEKKDIFAGTLADPIKLRKFANSILEIYKHKVKTGEGGQASAEVSSAIKGAFANLSALTDNQATAIYERLNESRVSEAICAVGGHYIEFEYKDEGNYIAFGKASPGQQAAALLELLLNQNAGTLIIDQPEDDLDNRRIMTIASRLHKSKSRRQIIFATHNANLLVNGDADKIVALNSGSEGGDVVGDGTARISIEVDGAIETQAIREKITNTMEGGKDAFKLRARKYLLHEESV